MPPLLPLPPMSPEQKSVLNRICTEVMFLLQPSNEELRERDFIIRDLSRFISKTYPTSRLTLYGSSCNGFAISRSDLDISLTFTDHPTDETVDSIQIIEKLAEKLKRMSGDLMLCKLPSLLLRTTCQTAESVKSCYAAYCLLDADKSYISAGW